MYPMQAGDVSKTWANIDDLIKDYSYKPKTKLKNGLANFLSGIKLIMNLINNQKICQEF